MEVLKRAVLGTMLGASLAIALAIGLGTGLGCYQPELRECVVACASSEDCAPTQLCGRDRLCASPTNAGRCHELDAGASDAGLDEHLPPLDAAPNTTLRIRTRGKGVVIVDGFGDGFVDGIVDSPLTCDHTAPGGECVYEVAAGAELGLHAFAAIGYRFKRWRAACEGEQPVCVVVAVAPMITVEAEFKKHGDDD